jgi:hypothetical protein
MIELSKAKEVAVKIDIVLSHFDLPVPKRIALVALGIRDHHL